MKLLGALLLGFILMIARPAYAQLETPNLPTVEELQAMSPEMRAIYIEGMKGLVVEIEDMEMAEGDEYASLHPYCPTPDRQPAADTSLSCVYAGFIQTKSHAEDLCPKPEVGSCGPGQVQCNPMLFGSGVCTRSGRHATSVCFQRSRAIADINKSHVTADWTAFADKLKSYCSSGKQPEVCRLVLKRVDRLNGKVSNAAAPAAAAGKKASPADTPAVVGVKGDCDPLLLLQEPLDWSAGQMSYREVYGLMCTSDDGPERAMKILMSHKPKNDTDKDNSFVNMQHCLAKADADRAAHKTPEASKSVMGEKYDFKSQTFVITLTKPVAGLKATYTAESQVKAEAALTSDMRFNDVSICATKPEEIGPHSGSHSSAAHAQPAATSAAPTSISVRPPPGAAAAKRAN